MKTHPPENALQHLIAEAAFDPSKWVSICEEMSHLAGAQGACLMPVDITSRSHRQDLALSLPVFPYSPNLEGLVTTYIAEEWNRKESRALGVPAMIKRGYMTDADSIAHDQIDRSSYYNDLLGKFGYRWFAGIGIQTSQSLSILAVQRKKNSQPFTESDLHDVLTYQPALNSAAAITHQLNYAHLQGAAEAYERQGFCAIGLDANQRVVLVSQSAQRFIGNKITIKQGRMSATDSAANPGLQKLLHAVTSRHSEDNTLFAIVPQTPGLHPLVLHGVRLPEMGCDIFRPAVGMIVITDPGQPLNHSEKLLMQLFDLTPTEALLARSFVYGISIESFAAQKDVSITTARNHLQSLMRKTNTHRQGELVAALLRVKSVDG